MQKSRKILIIAACVVILVAACIIAIPEIVGRSHDDDFTLKDIDAVTKVFITDKQNASTLLERHGTSWTVNGESPAFDEAVNAHRSGVQKKRAFHSAHDPLFLRLQTGRLQPRIANFGGQRDAESGL